ncbi:MAG: EAL domain-containing protein [Halofilum sp. (in: g-proteobacteria)]|nr:EAL domain-containing protein [Halofilum sp. (in: g-proteobacteria)]
MGDAHLTLAVVSDQETDRSILAALAHAAGLRVDTVLCAGIDALRARCEGDGVQIVAYLPERGAVAAGTLRDLLAGLPAPPQLVLVTEHVRAPDFARAQSLQADDVIDTTDAAHFEFVVRRGLRYAELRRELRTLRGRLRQTRLVDRAELQGPGNEDSGADPALAERIDQALRGDGFTLVFQPIVSLREEAEPGYEAFVRMRGEAGYVMPDEFLPVALRYGLLPAIDRWVVEHVVQRFVTERTRGDRPLRLFLNVSAHSLVEIRAVEGLLKTIGRARPPAGTFVIKIDKDTMLSRLESVKLLNRLVKEVGLQFAIDHFEASDSRLNYLDHVSVDYIKLHGSLIAGVDRDEGKYRAVEEIVAAARDHGIRVIASQVEHGTELTALYRIGVDFAQGYLIAEPSEALEHEIGLAEVLG